MPKITFTTNPYNIGSTMVLQLPKTASAKLPSRGMVMVSGTINDFAFQTPLEPDGKGSHWMRIQDSFAKRAGIAPANTANVSLEATKDWPEPSMPADVQTALEADLAAQLVWQSITPMARWDWLRWIQGTKNDATRKRRIEVMRSKMNNGSRRPCCFNRSECTDPEVSKSGVLLEPVL